MLQDAATQLGLGAVRYTQQWSPGQSRITANDASNLARGIANARGLRVVLSVYGAASSAPQTDGARGQYCAYVRSIVQRFPQIHDVVIWNEANSSHFWSPQFSSSGKPVSPKQYEALLAACYGTLQTARTGMNVVANVAPRGNDDPQAKGIVGVAPGTFIRDLGVAYRASGRRVKIFDTFALNVYGLNSAERPWLVHPHSTDISEGDYPRLIAALAARLHRHRPAAAGRRRRHHLVPRGWLPDDGARLEEVRVHRRREREAHDPGARRAR